MQTEKLQKGVPYTFARALNLMNKERLQRSLKRSLSFLAQKSSYLYGHWHMSRGVLGLTPELLFSYEESSKKIYTMALAGTCNSLYSQENFLKNEKERHEHRLVIQGLQHSLQKMGKVHVGETQIILLSKLMHLMTPIEAKLDHPLDFEALVSCLHPTPALGAFPVESGRKWLQDLQKNLPRHYYGSPVGFRFFQKYLAQCFVGIRNVQWNKLGMSIGAGCGVVKQSTFENEWEEIQLKVKTIREQFNL